MSTKDEIYRLIKNAGGWITVEVYPEQSNLVNVANMRHLFILPVRPEFAWSKKNGK